MQPNELNVDERVRAYLDAEVVRHLDHLVNGVKTSLDDYMSLLKSRSMPSSQPPAPAPASSPSSPPPVFPAAPAMVPSLPDQRPMAVARGNKIQRYTPDGATLLQTYIGPTEASRDTTLDAPTPPGIRTACRNRTVYKGFRWAELERDMDDGTRQDIGETVEAPTQRKGLVAMLHVNGSHIVRVFGDQLEAARDRGFTKSGPISAAISRGSPSGGHRFRLWHDCPEEMKRDYLARAGPDALPRPPPPSNGRQIEQVDAQTGRTVQTFPSAAHVMKHFRMSRASLYQAIDQGLAKNGFLWRHSLAAESSDDGTEGEHSPTGFSSASEDEADDDGGNSSNSNNRRVAPRRA